MSNNNSKEVKMDTEMILINPQVTSTIEQDPNWLLIVDNFDY